MPEYLQDHEKDNASSFGFDTYSDALVAASTNPSLQTPFTIAIYGDWGSGKTSLMKTVSRKIQLLETGKAIVIWFNAWQYEKSEQPLWSTFLTVVLSELSQLAKPKNREEFKRIARKITIIGSQLVLSKISGLTPTELKDLAITLQNNLKEIRTLRDQLADSIEKALSDDKDGRERVVIFIDDLDRCLPDRVVEVFESIKLFLDCERCVFILGFDKEQVKRAFELRFPSKTADLGSRYIEKFVQLEFELPPKTVAQVEQFVKTIAPLELKNNQSVLDIISKFIEPNPRKILRWINRVIFIQELFRFASHTEGSTSSQTPETVAVWVFIKSFFPEFAALVEKDQSILYLVIKRSKGEAANSELERIKEVTTDKLLDDFLKSLSQSVITDPRLSEVIFQTKLTVTESVSILQPDSMIQKIDTVSLEEVDPLATELIANTKAKALEIAKLIGEKLQSIKTRAEYMSSANRIRFIQRIASSVTTSSEKKTMYDVLIAILRSLQAQYFWDYTNELKLLLTEQKIHDEALSNGHVDLFVSNFVESTSWDYAGQFSEILLPFSGELTQEQAHKIALAGLTNIQVYDSFRARPDVTKILKANKHLIGEDNWNKLLKERAISFKLKE